MKRSIVVALALLALGVPATLLAQQDGAPPAANTLVKVTAAPLAVNANARAQALVHLAISPGWHINANPPTFEYNIPTKLSLAAAFGLAPGRPGYPAGAG